ncbi:hypothetical protein D3C80_1402400 [compost metagenome]
MRRSNGLLSALASLPPGISLPRVSNARTWLKPGRLRTSGRMREWKVRTSSRAWAGLSSSCQRPKTCTRRAMKSLRDSRVKVTTVMASSS